MSYLVGVRKDLNRLVDALRQELPQSTSREEQDQLFKEWSSELWKFVASQLKYSYGSGLHAGTTGIVPNKRRRFADWRTRGADDPAPNS